jgi:hypothetical protein
MERGAAHGIRPEIMSALYNLIIREACHIEDEIIDDPMWHI